jgi:hypothetical protein
VVTAPQPETPRAVDKSVEGWFLFKAGVPLIASGIGPAVLYAWLAASSELDEYWIGTASMLAGAVLGIVGIVRRVREIRSPDVPNPRHYWLLFLSWALVVAGLLVPPYLSA